MKADFTTKPVVIATVVLLFTLPASIANERAFVLGGFLVGALIGVLAGLRFVSLFILSIPIFEPIIELGALGNLRLWPVFLVLAAAQEAARAAGLGGLPKNSEWFWPVTWAAGVVVIQLPPLLIDGVPFSLDLIKGTRDVVLSVFVAVFAYTASSKWSIQDFKNSLQILVVSASTYVILNIFGIFLVDDFPTTHQGNRILFPTDNPNLLGLFLLAALFAFFFLSKTDLKFGFLVSSSILVLGVFLTGSRASLLGMAVFFATDFFLNLRDRKKLVYLTVVSGGGFLASCLLHAISLATREIPLGLFSIAAKLQPGQLINDPRSNLWAESVKSGALIPDDAASERVNFLVLFFGMGPRQSFNPHNTWLQIFVDFGVFGLLLFGLPVFWLLKKAIRSKKYREVNGATALGIAMFFQSFMIRSSVLVSRSLGDSSNSGVGPPN